MLGLRWHFEWKPYSRGAAVWVPWRHESDPLVYAFWMPSGGKWSRWI